MQLVFCRASSVVQKAEFLHENNNNGHNIHIYIYIYINININNNIYIYIYIYMGICYITCTSIKLAPEAS